MKFFNSSINIRNKSFKQALNYSKYFLNIQKHSLKSIHINDIPSLKDFNKLNQKGSIQGI